MSVLTGGMTWTGTCDCVSHTSTCGKGSALSQKYPSQERTWNVPLAGAHTPAGRSLVGTCRGQALLQTHLPCPGLSSVCNVRRRAPAPKGASLSVPPLERSTVPARGAEALPALPHHPVFRRTRFLSPPVFLSTCHPVPDSDYSSLILLHSPVFSCHLLLLLPLSFPQTISS